MNVFLLRQSEPEGRIEASLRATIPGLIEAASFDLVLKHKSAAEDHEPPTVLVVSPPGDEAFFERLVEVAAQYHKELFLILISDEISASAYKRLVRTGGAEWASAKAAPREVVEIIARRGQQRRGSDKASSGPRNSAPVTICFVPSAGGVGNTTLVIKSAIYFENK